MTSFYNAIISARGNWFQISQPNHESNDRALLLCVGLLPMRKIWHFRGKIWSAFVTVFWFNKTDITDGIEILVLVRVLWDVIFKIYWQFWRFLFKNTLETSYKFCLIEITWRKMVKFNLFETSVNGNMTFAYIIMFHCIYICIRPGTNRQKRHLYQSVQMPVFEWENKNLNVS